MRKIIKQVLSCTLLLAGVYSVALAQTEKPTMPTTITAMPPTETSRTSAAIANRGARDENQRKYRIGAGDEIIVEVFKHPEFNVIRRVDERGLISLSRIDRPIQAVCKTENELSEEIAGYYKKYLRQPYVSVYVRDYKSQPVSVMGAVEKGGTFFINREMRLIQAVALAGGPSKEAGAKVILARMGDVDLCAVRNANEASEAESLKGKFFTYNLRRMIEGDNAANPMLEPGDIVSVLESEKAYVVGNVKEPKTILLKEPRTLTQAIAEAQGVETSTKLKEIFILRIDEKGTKTRTPYNVLEINAGKQQDPYLMPNDIVEVPTDNKKSTFENLKKAFINGLPAVLPWIL